MTPTSAASTVQTVTEQTFEREVMSVELPVMVAFVTSFSNPCKIMEPELVAIAHELEGKAKVVRVDAERSPMIAQEFQVKAIPAVAVVHQGRVVAAKQGLMRRADLRALVEPFLPRSESAIRVEEFVQLAKAGRVMAVDTRDAGSFSRAHVPGAVHMPLAEIEAKVYELASTGKAPVLYDRAGTESKILAEKLAEQGVPVAFLEGGFLAWEVAGQPIERG
jgi:thioredoxin 1/putative thioredoxin